jgi:phosphoglycerate dehydrogenase-like enzyme
MIKLFVYASVAAVVGLAAVSAAAQSPIERLVEQTGVEEAAVASRELPRWREPTRVIVRARYDAAEVIASELPGAEVIVVTSSAEALPQVAGAEAIIGFCPEDLIAAGSNLVWVQIFSAGAERCFGSERIASGDVVLTNMQKMASPVIAEHVTAMTLALMRGLVAFGKHMDSGEWLRDAGPNAQMQSIAGKTMLVAGLGGIGTEVARRAAALDMRVVATRRSSREGPDFVAYVGLSDELAELAAEADVIVNALPLTPETEGLFDAKFFAAAKEGAYFINVGRGGSVVTADLLAALESGRLAGAGLDVTDPEPLPADHPLWQQQNVIITPHVASDGGNWARQSILLRENVRRFAAGEPLLNVVDPELGY